MSAETVDEPELTDESSPLDKLRGAVRALNRAKAECELAVRILESLPRNVQQTGPATACGIVEHRVLNPLTDAIVETMLIRLTHRGSMPRFSNMSELSKVFRRSKKQRYLTDRHEGIPIIHRFVNSRGVQRIVILCPLGHVVRTLNAADWSGSSEEKMVSESVVCFGTLPK